MLLFTILSSIVLSGNDDNADNVSNSFNVLLHNLHNNYCVVQITGQRYKIIGNAIGVDNDHNATIGAAVR